MESPTSLARFFFTGMLGVSVGMLLVSATAPGQEIGNAEAGLRYALQVCSGCHAVRPGQGQSPQPAAPRFVDVSNTPGMTAIALTAWLQRATMHDMMPHLKMKDEDMRNVIQYILSLKAKVD
jgi:mono/diheme cytochrome c family protein